MFHQSTKQILPGIFVALLLITTPAYAVKNYKISNYGGGHQIWFEAEDFDERNPDTDQYYPVVDKAGAFGQAINRAGGAGGMIRWTFDISKAGGKGGTWYFWARLINPSNASDYMLVEGDPDDAEIPTGPPFPGDNETPPFINADDRIFEENVGTEPDNWAWGLSNHEEGQTKELQNGENTMYIFDRGGNNTVFWDVFVWADSANYVPTDEDFENAMLDPLGKASNPSPANEALHEDTWLNLSWEAGDFAVSHDVYFGENFDDVNDGAAETFRGNQPSAFFVVGFPGFPYPDGLIPGTTYYWRVDEVNDLDPNSPWKGDVWSFIIPPRTAYDPNPADGIEFVDTTVELSWMVGLGARLHHVYFGDNFADVNAGASDTYKGPVSVISYSLDNLELDKAYYWRVDEFALSGTHKGDVWSFRTLPEVPITNPNLVGWWKLDEGAVAFDWSGHGNHGTLEGDPQWVAGYDGDALEFDGKGDYVELPTGIIGSVKGSISMWIKTIQAVRGMIFYSSDGTSGDGYGDDNELHVNVENGGGIEFVIEGGDSDVSIESSALNDDSWHHIAATWDINGQANLYVDGGAPISVTHTGNDFNLSSRIRLGRPNANSRYYAGLLDDVRVYDYVLSPDDIAITMRGDVKLAWNPKPANEAILNKREVSSLSWSPGDNASQHDVYLGTDRDAVANADASDTTGTYRGRQGAASYTPPEGIQWGQSHYWRIDEYNTDATITKGRIWSFSILDFILVEDFEDYNDFPPDEIFNAWIDGYGTTTNGSTAGYPEPDWNAGEHYVETTIVHGGDQSMPYFYDNNLKYSEATMTLSYPRDWTEEGVGVLSLWFHGRLGSVGSFTEGPVGTYTITATGADIWDEADEFHFAYKTLTGPGTIIAKVESVENTDPWAKSGVMIRETLDAGSKFAAVYIMPTNADGTPTQGCRFQGRKDTDGSAESDTSVATAEQMAITAPYWVKLERDVAGNFRASYSSNGVTWQSMVWRQSITMSSNVYVGLALTSHNNNATGEAKFSNIQITGTVTGQWQSQDIGIPSNAAEPMYVALNGSASVYHGNPDAALIDEWTHWPIDLQEFAAQGVNLASVNTIAIGFGDKNNLQAGGSGMVFFDDIRLYRLAPEPAP